MEQTSVLSHVKRLPRELRDEVYENSTNYIKDIEITQRFQGSILDYLGSQLPNSLNTDKETTEEAAMASLRVAMRIVESIKVPNPESLLLPSTVNMTWDAVRQLEFTAAQLSYDSASEAKSTNENATIKQIVSQCPELRYLTIRINDSMIVASPTVQRGDERLHARMINSKSTLYDLLQVFDHPKIIELTLNVANAVQPTLYGRYEYPQKLSPFIDAFEQESKTKGRHVKLKVELSPGVVKNPRNPEMARHEQRGVTWIQYYDFFG